VIVLLEIKSQTSLGHSSSLPSSVGRDIPNIQKKVASFEPLAKV